MRKLLFLSVSLAMAMLLMPSCNKNRFDFNQLDTVEGSGQWKFPVGSIHKTLGDVMGQLNNNQLISYDENGNLQVAYHFGMDNIINGSSFMSLPTMTYDAHFETANPCPYQLPYPIDTSARFNQEIKLNPDGMRLEMAKIKTGTIDFHLVSNLGNFQDIILRSDNLKYADGSSWEEKLNISGDDSIDLSGVTLEVGEDSIVNFSYEVHYQMYNILDPLLVLDAKVELANLKLRQLSGYIDTYETPFSFDTAFSMPLDKVSGHLKIVDAKLQIQTKNTFDLFANLQLNEAQVYGGGIAPSMIFGEYPVVVQVKPSEDYTFALDETFTLEFDTRYDAIRLGGKMVFNPAGAEQLISIYDTSTMGIAFDAKIPMKLNVPGVNYLDTINFNIADFDASKQIEEVLLNLGVNSELPFNLQAQLFTFDSKTGKVTDSLMTHTASIAGSFDGKPVKSETEISVTQDRLQNLLKADKLIMRFGLNTDNHDVLLNLDNGLDVNIKADLFYGE